MKKPVALVAFITISLSVAVTTSRAPAQPATFTTQTDPLLGNNHVAADLNSGGSPDLAGSGANSADVMLNNGDGTFRPKVGYPVAGQTQDVAAGDFNADDIPDLAVTINTPQVSGSLLAGNAEGMFGPPTNSPVLPAQIRTLSSPSTSPTGAAEGTKGASHG